MATAQLIIIGNEILNGRTLERNAHHLAQKLNDNGIAVKKIVTIADDPEAIENAFREAMQNVEVIIATGGLGPTKDDITKSVLAKLFDCQVVYSEEAMASIRDFLAQRGKEVKGLNEGHAYVPAKAKPLPNKSGTAPGLLFEEEGQSIVSLPGVPSEMRYLTEYEVLPFIKRKYAVEEIHHSQILTVGIPEAVLAQKISDLEEGLPESVKLAYLPDWGIVKLRLTGEGLDHQTFKGLADQFAKRVYDRVGQHIFGYDDDTLPGSVGQLVKANNKSIATSESCTGGYLGHMITSIPGSSDFFAGGLITYSNAWKMQLLGVSEETLEKDGAVSQATVEEMVKGTIDHFGVDYAIATSGVAGPSGGTEEKPVGTVWIAAGDENQVFSHRFRFFNDRQKNIHFSAIMGMDMLRQFLKFGKVEYEY